MCFTCSAALRIFSSAHIRVWCALVRYLRALSAKENVLIAPSSRLNDLTSARATVIAILSINVPQVKRSVPQRMCAHARVSSTNYISC
jgi:hypothetical protein